MQEKEPTLFEQEKLTKGIIAIYAENFKHLKVVELNPDPHFQVISGENAQGKSCILEAIQYAFEGAAALKNTPDPIRQGTDRAMIRVITNDLLIKRVIRKSGPELVVSTREGAEWKRGQEVLDKVRGSFFDPGKFLEMNAKEQKEVFLKLCKLDFTASNRAREALVKNRTLIKNSIKERGVELRSASAKVTWDRETTPKQEISLSVLTNKLDEIRSADQERLNLQHRLKELEANKQSIKSAMELDKQEIVNLLQEIENLKKSIKSYSSEEEELAGEIAAKKLEISALSVPDAEPIHREIEQLEETNRRVRTEQEEIKYRDLIVSLTKELDKVEGDIQKIETDNKAKLDAANPPMKGLGFNEDGITLNEIALSQCAESEKMKVAMSIGLALSPHLPVFWFRNGSQFDAKNRTLIAKYAKEKGVQIFMELVDSGKQGICISEGEIISNNPSV